MVGSGEGAAPGDATKEPFDVDEALARIRTAVAPYPAAAMFALAEAGHGSVFEQLVACVISIRTYDEVSLPAARRLLAAAPDAAAVAALDPAEIEALIQPSSFAERKAVQLREIARRTVAEHGGALPCDPAVLTDFAGVGPKCAHLALGTAWPRHSARSRRPGRPRPPSPLATPRPAGAWSPRFARASAPRRR